MPSPARLQTIEYDVLLTGAVHHMQIITLEEKGSDDPLQQLLGFGKRTVDRLSGKPAPPPPDPNRRRLP